jgi:hypothetical protein
VPALTESEELAYLRRRLVFLEEQVQRLRLSRRVLMNLLLTQEQVKRGEISQLQAENERLRRHQSNSLHLVELHGQQD